MPIYMDIHNVPGVNAKDVAEAHRLDMSFQEHHNCKCMTYWIDEERENVFCLIEAPEKQAVERLHAYAHGLLPSKIIEVNSSLVESFLGRIYDPSDVVISSDGLKVFRDPSFRILLITKITDSVLLRHRLGEERTAALLDAHKTIIRRTLQQFAGREVEQEGTDFIGSFRSASDAVSAARNIQAAMYALDDADQIEFTIGIDAGEPVEKSDELFGDALETAGHLCAIARNFQVAVGSAVKDLAWKDHFHKADPKLLTVTPEDENVLKTLFAKLEENWQDPEFDITKYCQATIMSKSQLYRRVITLTGVSPNQLLKDFRLERARTMMKKRHSNIAQITFECGFTSPSYFTKCFKKTYGLLPMAYIDLLS